MNSRTKTRKYSPAEIEARKAERAARIAALEAAAESFELDEDDRAMMRAFTDLSSHYSEGNALLILAQAAEQGLKVKGLSDVGAFGKWTAEGRAPKKGSHASIFVWVPVMKESQADKTEEVKDATTGTRVRKGYRLAPLFHKSQTEKIQPKEEAKVS